MKMTLLFLLLAGVSGTFAQGLQQSWNVMDGGGGRVTSGNLTLLSSVGQPSPSNSLTSGSFVLEGGYVPGLRNLGGTSTTFSQQLQNTWNLVSVPVSGSDMRKIVLYPTAISPAFAYVSSAYQLKDTLLNGVGYWMKFSGSQTAMLSGTTFAPETINVGVGWNMIGTISYTALKASIVASGGASITSQYFSYTAGIGYSLQDTLKPGLGYWAKSSGAGKLIIPPAPTIAPSQVSISSNGEQSKSARISFDGMPADGFQQLKIADGVGASKSIYLGIERKEVDLAKYELPPLPPDELLDVRFASQRIVEMPKTPTDQFPVQVSGGAYPMTISWDGSASIGASYVLDVRWEGRKIQTYDLNVKGSVVLEHAPVSIKVRVVNSNIVELPKEFALYQNYPNPFNPSTKIRYDLPRNGIVLLKVYNLLGQEVQTLVNNEAKDAGRYTYEMNASNLSSGVYYYRLEVRNANVQSNSVFSNVKKLLLMK